MEILISLEQGGYHELQNEPDGVKEKLLEEVVSFIDDHLASSTLVEEAGSEPLVSETINRTDSAKAKM
jgi:acylglycerol lipase